MTNAKEILKSANEGIGDSAKLAQTKSEDSRFISKISAWNPTIGPIDAIEIGLVYRNETWRH